MHLSIQEQNIPLRPQFVMKLATSMSMGAPVTSSKTLPNRLGWDEKQLRFRRLLEAFSKPIREVYLLFFQATLPVFSTFNRLPQREIKADIGFTTQATLNTLLDAGDITLQQVERFQLGSTGISGEGCGVCHEETTPVRVWSGKLFGRLSFIAKLVLVPHSNADAERLFSSNLSSIMTVKMGHNVSSGSPLPRGIKHLHKHLQHGTPL
ncbi:hypothetical protein N1851_006847 [Merluccius polli]|uniref:HAT C-terminal dimerisation domain-containing protein n=1 Tax=Merluccius polli TaxID=89951 RepID=A0AA47N3M1_MERPO|nr:hypothetical protein N1851_006847 [Merluccius polli]